jgi:branched-chain amino acid transport system substrate-binding protein
LIRAARLWRVVVLLASAMCGAGSLARAEPGVTDRRIVIGTSVPLSGRSAEHGAELVRGIRLGFERLNASGGIGGRSVELLARDDGGSPERAVSNTRELIADGVLVVTGYLGVDSIEAVLPLIERAGVPVIGVATSAELTRDPVRPLVFNLRAGARDEAAAIISQLDSIGLTSIAAISQDDALGRAAREGIRIELARLAMSPVVQVQLAAGADERAFKGAVDEVCKSRPQALVLLMDATSASLALRMVRQRSCAGQIVVLSDAGAQMVAESKTPGELAGLVVAQVLPSPASLASPWLVEYAHQVAAAGAKPGYPSLEGYVYARIIGEALARCARDMTRRCIVAALEARPIDLAGYRVQFTPADHRGSRYVDMTIVTSNGRFRR